MPRIDPLQLLGCLEVLLTPNGGIKSDQEVTRIVSLMEKFSKKLVSKCVYLLILKSSDVYLLSKFMTSGGWTLIYNWLLHAVQAKNYPFLFELLEVIYICPVDIERLKSNPMPRQIKFLSKDTSVDPRVRDLASDIVKHWLAVVKGTPVTSVANHVGADSITVSSPICTTAVELKSHSKDQPDARVSHVSVDEEDEEINDANYVKSTSPSDSSQDSDESDVFVPYKKIQTKKKLKTPVKKDNSSLNDKPNHVVNKLKLKNKSIKNDLVDRKDAKVSSLKLKIAKKNDDLETVTIKRIKSDISTLVKEKSRSNSERERDKFLKLQQLRENKRDKRDKLKEKNRERVAAEEKLKVEKLQEDLSKLIPKPLGKLGRIPKKSKEPDEQRKDDEKRKKDDKQSPSSPPPSKSKENDREVGRKEKKSPLPAPPKKQVSMSVERRFVTEAKPKTVKAYNSKPRLTGLEEEVVPKPPTKKSNAGSASHSVKRSPPKDAENEPSEKRIKSPDVSNEDKTSPVTAKTKKPFLQESDFFMNAMTTAVETQKENLRKRKKPGLNQKSDAESKPDESPSRKNADGMASPTIKTEKTDVPKPAFKFYKDTMDVSNDENSENGTPTDIKPAFFDVKPSIESNDEDFKNVEVKVESEKEKSNGAGLKSSLTLFHNKNKPKKSVKWKMDDELEMVQYFEVDVSERTNVVRSFWDMQAMERTKEREMLMVRKTENDKMAPQTNWKPLIPIDVPPSTTVRGCNSQEKNIQYARERTVPPATYYTKSQIPDTPAEMDFEVHSIVNHPPVIPLEDISGSQDSVYDYSTSKWPEPKQLPPDGSDPNIMNAFMAGNPAGMPPPMFPPFPDGTFPPPFGQPFYPGGPVPVPPAGWTPGNTDQNQQNPTTMPMNWPPPPPGCPPGMIAPPFGMMAPPFPPMPNPGFPGAPNMFNPANMNQQPMNNSSGPTDNKQYSNSNNSNNYSSSHSEGSSNERRKWNNDDRYNDDRYHSRKDSWKSGSYQDRGRDSKRNSSSSWRGGGSRDRDSRLCRTFQKKGYCNVSHCRFNHPEK